MKPLVHLPPCPPTCISMLFWSDLLNPLPGRLSISPITSPTHTQPCHPLPALQPSLQIGSNILSTSYDVELNWQTTLDILYEYGPGTHMEYPATKYDGCVGHLFTGLDIENWVNPMAYFAYSLGPPKGSNKNGSCNILLGDEGVRVPCRVTHFTCMYMVPNRFLVLNFEYLKAKVERCVHVMNFACTPIISFSFLFPFLSSLICCLILSQIPLSIYSYL